jgi:hypothetical protein
MKVRFTASVAAMLLLSGVALSADIKSGPQKGEGLKAFNPLHATGKGAGGKQCLV